MNEYIVGLLCLLGICICCHIYIKKFNVAIIVSGIITSLLNIGHEIYKNDLDIRPSSLFIWIPINFIMTMAITAILSYFIWLVFFKKARN